MDAVVVDGLRVAFTRVGGGCLVGPAGSFGMSDHADCLAGLVDGRPWSWPVSRG